MTVVDSEILELAKVVPRLWSQQEWGRLFTKAHQLAEVLASEYGCDVNADHLSRSVAYIHTRVVEAREQLGVVEPEPQTSEDDNWEN